MYFSEVFMYFYVFMYSDHSILECYNLFSGVELSMRSFFVIFCNSLNSSFKFLFKESLSKTIFCQFIQNITIILLNVTKYSNISFVLLC